MMEHGELVRRIRLGEDSTLELKRVLVAGSRITAPRHDEFADELAAIASDCARFASTRDERYWVSPIAPSLRRLGQALVEEPLFERRPWHPRAIGARKALEGRDEPPRERHCIPVPARDARRRRLMSGRLALNRNQASDGSERESWQCIADSALSSRTARPGGGRRSSLNFREKSA